MKTIQKFMMISTIILLGGISICLFSSAAESQENTALKSMITELETKIKDADKRMVAHPTFLEELRELIEKYKASIRKLYFKDSFMDKNFSKAPKWTVTSGTFFVNDALRLSTSVYVEPSEPQKETSTQQGTKSVEEQAIGLVLDNLFGTPKKEADTQDTQTQETKKETTPASILSKTDIPPDFEINVEFLSNSQWGDFEIILLGKKTFIPRYRLSYKAVSSGDRPMELIRESKKRKFVIEAATKYPATDDGKLHKISWIRYQNGAMTILMDNKVILETYEVYFRDNFTGISILNNGGSYEFASVEIFKALPQTQ
ncbi:MAG: hypothetical protein GY729_19010 [Desulfobacteraceae bacterium]|nr:hypothetical protein [Desulfobacteraceae bacterium]